MATLRPSYNSSVTILLAKNPISEDICILNSLIKSKPINNTVFFVWLYYKLKPGSQKLKGRPREILGQTFLKRSISRSYFLYKIKIYLGSV